MKIRRSERRFANYVKWIRVSNRWYRLRRLSQVSGNAHAANIEEKAAILAKLAKEVKPKPPSKLELLKQQHSLEANSDSEEVLYDEEVYPKISNASDVNAIFFYNPSENLETLKLKMRKYVLKPSSPGCWTANLTASRRTQS